MKHKHGAILNRFTAKFSPDTVENWVDMIEEWDLDKSKPNPYEESCKGLLCIYFIIQGSKRLPATTMADVRLELAKEELAEAKNGAELMHDVSPNTFLHVGLELEEQQYVVNTCAFFWGLTSLSDDFSSNIYPLKVQKHLRCHKSAKFFINV
jgi:hypothetical protein